MKYVYLFYEEKDVNNIIVFSSYEKARNHAEKIGLTYVEKLDNTTLLHDSNNTNFWIVKKPVK